ncbi:GlsB/YeaQ/YmgE family stress response membrane protein [Nitratidesulfovibrio sp.]|uniref:GlsB/YeaQ/YmgE family stress response membrane protein n=1 Tax=Nitratidesulfovibrio sp. TaxID=2802297 RepID=UPI00333E6DEE
MENLLWFLIIGLVAGWLAGTLMKGGGFGLVGDLIVGIVGAVIGGVLFGAIGIGGGGLLGAILMATVGAVILILCLRMLKRA